MHDEPTSGRPGATPSPDSGAKVPALSQTLGGGKHRTSGGEASAALGAAAGEDGTTGAGAHPEPKTVGLGPPTVVRLEGALAHERLQGEMGRPMAGPALSHPRTPTKLVGMRARPSTVDLFTVRSGPRAGQISRRGHGVDDASDLGPAAPVAWGRRLVGVSSGC